MPFASNRLDGRRVYFEDDGGQGSPVAVLGGFLDLVELVRRAPIARALSDLRHEFRLIFIDHRGHGRSDKPHDPEAYQMTLRVETFWPSSTNWRSRERTALASPGADGCVAAWANMPQSAFGPS
jgi:pimeloyl-ACP methyl ester carboxylesterase